jgi:hypothetical protein
MYHCESSYISKALIIVVIVVAKEYFRQADLN